MCGWDKSPPTPFPAFCDPQHHLWASQTTNYPQRSSNMQTMWCSPWVLGHEDLFRWGIEMGVGDARGKLLDFVRKDVALARNHETKRISGWSSGRNSVTGKTNVAVTGSAWWNLKQNLRVLQGSKQNCRIPIRKFNKLTKFSHVDISKRVRSLLPLTVHVRDNNGAIYEVCVCARVCVMTAGHHRD